MDIVFCVLPFAVVEYPAIGVSLLQARLRQLGFSSTIRYFHLDLAARIGLELYEWIAQRTQQQLPGPSAPPLSMIGEWFFADLVFGDGIPREEEYIANFLEPDPQGRRLIPKLMRARCRRQPFIQHCVGQIRRLNPRLVGFTSSFHQTCACLAVAKGLKEAADPPITIFGGPNCEGEMGQQLVQSFAWVDYVCTGEGDEVVPLFVQSLLREDSRQAIPGILKKGDPLSIPAPVRQMDGLPFPDYSDYLSQLKRSTLAHRISPRLLIQTSRGCWWGEKQHCTFCGLNGETMGYRSKSPPRVIQEIQSLTGTYGVNRIDCVDNILDLKYIDTVFPELARGGAQLEFFFETKANLRFEQLRTLREGGVRNLLPGIESFSNVILGQMRKGCTALQNLNFLRWSEELGILVTWNLLFGFPAEPPSAYAEMAKLVPLLVHLEPPMFCQRIRMDRFSPLFMDSEKQGLTRRRPAPAYSYVFPLDPRQLERIAYYFDFDYADGRDPSSYTRELVREIEKWTTLRNSKRRPRLDLFQTSQAVVIQDTRPCATCPVQVLTGLAAEIYLACDTAQTTLSLSRGLPSRVVESTLRGLLEPFLEAGLMVEMDGHYLSLAVLRNRVLPDRPRHPAAMQQVPADQLVQLV